MNAHYKTTLNRRRGRPRSEVARNLPELLLDAAEPLFLAQGYGATTVEQVAQNVGATKRTIYAKFGDKAGLFAAVTRRLVDRHRGWLAEAAAGDSIDERLSNFGLRLLAEAGEADVLALYRVMMGEVHRFPELARLVAELASTGARRGLAALLRREAAAGTLSVPDAEVAAEFLVGMILHARLRGAMLGQRTAAEADAKRWVQAAVALFLDGCRAPSGRCHAV